MSGDRRCAAPGSRRSRPARGRRAGRRAASIGSQRTSSTSRLRRNEPDRRCIAQKRTCLRPTLAIAVPRRGQLGPDVAAQPGLLVHLAHARNATPSPAARACPWAATSRHAPGDGRRGPRSRLGGVVRHTSPPAASITDPRVDSTARAVHASTVNDDRRPGELAAADHAAGLRSTRHAPIDRDVRRRRMGRRRRRAAAPGWASRSAQPRRVDAHGCSTRSTGCCTPPACASRCTRRAATEPCCSPATASSACTRRRRRRARLAERPAGRSAPRPASPRSSTSAPCARSYGRRRRAPGACASTGGARSSSTPCSSRQAVAEPGDLALTPATLIELEALAGYPEAGRRSRPRH